MKLFNKILIANRGEIAARIIKSAKALGVKTVAVYSRVDEDLLHVKMADEKYCIGDVELSETYLNINKIIEIAKIAGCDAVHPGYGFMAENPSFVKACEDAKITFIGPDSRAIQLMGNKIEAREFVKGTGVPVTEGVTGDRDVLIKAGKKIPFPLLVKAAAGGGGKGMRIVHNEKELENAIESTSREAKSYFGDGTVYIEKFIEDPRHIEIQIIADNFGNVVHLFERECSIQRRYQKIVEESPSVTLSDEVRNKMGEAAVKIGKEIGYSNAGTIEFMVDKDLNYYFLEMNTRVQVEHPVTEMVTGVDIVEEQILIAAGNELRLKQSEIAQTGHSIECRIYAEDPTNEFLPSPGDMTLYLEPKGMNVRVDTGVTGAATIESFYDPMIAKLIVWGEDREEARLRMIDALNNFIVQGIKTNINYLVELLKHKSYIENKISTKFCEKFTEKINSLVANKKEKIDRVIPLIGFLLFDITKKYISDNFDNFNIWTEIGYWRELMAINMKLDEDDYVVSIDRSLNGHIDISILDKSYRTKVMTSTDDSITFMIDRTYHTVYVSQDTKGNAFVTADGYVFVVNRLDMLMGSMESKGFGDFGKDGNTLNSPMPGKVIKVNCKEGDEIKQGDILMVIEAMKMENNIIANKDASIDKVTVKQGDMVDGDAVLIVLNE